MEKQYTVALYGAANDYIPEFYKRAGEELGRQLGQHNFALIYGAGATGMMGAVARGMSEVDAPIIGVAPHWMADHEPIFADCEFWKTETMSWRKWLIENNCDAFIIAPGGIGTLDEFYQAITLKELDCLDDKPVIVFNVNGIFNEDIAGMKRKMDEGFLREGALDLFTVCDEPQEVIQALGAQLLNRIPVEPVYEPDPESKDVDDLCV